MEAKQENRVSDGIGNQSFLHSQMLSRLQVLRAQWPGVETVPIAVIRIAALQWDLSLTLCVRGRAQRRYQRGHLPLRRRT